MEKRIIDKNEIKTSEFLEIESNENIVSIDQFIEKDDYENIDYEDSFISSFFKYTTLLLVSSALIIGLAYSFVWIVKYVFNFLETILL